MSSIAQSEAQTLITQNLRASHDIISTLEQSKASVERMIDALPDVFVVVDQSGRVLKGNSTAAMLFGLDIEHLLGQRLQTIFRPETWRLFVAKMEQLSVADAAETVAEFELLVDAQRRDLAFHWNVKILDETSRRRGPLFSVFGRDITQIRAYERQLSQIFSNIPLGIVSVDSDGRVVGPYSAYTEYLLGTGQLASRSIREVLFEPAMAGLSKAEQLGVEELFQVFGQEEIWFDSSKDRFPSEFLFPVPNSTVSRWLGVTYHSVIQSGIVSTILIIVTDRTDVVMERKRREQEAQSENLIAARFADVQRCDVVCLATSFEDLGGSFERLAAANDTKNVRQFCNVLHAIKGVARTAGLRALKSLASSVEEEILPMQQPGGLVDLARLAAAYGQLQAEWRCLVATHAAIDNMRHGDHQAATASGSSSEADLRLRLTQLVDELDISDAARQRLAGLLSSGGGSESVDASSLEARWRDRAQKTATELGKKIDLHCSWCKTPLQRTVASQLSEIVMHLLNNAIDHGVELPDLRKQRGKDPTGHLRMTLRDAEGGWIEAEFTDDGAGIDVGKIRQRAVERGLVTEAGLAKMTDGEARMLIFAPGFSTAATVTDISGRGIGLDSVREGIRQLGGGDITVEPGETSGSCFRFKFRASMKASD